MRSALMWLVMKADTSVTLTLLTQRWMLCQLLVQAFCVENQIANYSIFWAREQPFVLDPNTLHALVAIGTGCGHVLNDSAGHKFLI